MSRRGEPASFGALAIYGVLVASGAVAVVLLERCTPAELGAARLVAELAAKVCTQGDDTLACLRKCEHEAARQQPAAPDAGPEPAE